MNDFVSIARDLARTGLLKYTLKAFRALPLMNNPRILDLGCGSGIPTIALVKEGGGKAVAIDTDNIALKRLAIGADDEGLSEKIRTIQASITRLPDELGLFDLVWAEGCTQFIGFERALEYWPRFLKSGGHLVLHEDYANLDDKLRLVTSKGLCLLEHFVLTSDIWWQDYYRILEEEIGSEIQLMAKADGQPAGLEDAQDELKQFRSNPERFGSAFIIARKD